MASKQKTLVFALLGFAVLIFAGLMISTNGNPFTVIGQSQITLSTDGSKWIATSVALDSTEEFKFALKNKQSTLQNGTVAIGGRNVRILIEPVSMQQRIQLTGAIQSSDNQLWGVYSDDGLSCRTLRQPLQIYPYRAAGQVLEQKYRATAFDADTGQVLGGPETVTYSEKYGAYFFNGKLFIEGIALLQSGVTIPETSDLGVIVDGKTSDLSEKFKIVSMSQWRNNFLRACYGEGTTGAGAASTAICELTSNCHDFVIQRTANFGLPNAYQGRFQSVASYSPNEIVLNLYPGQVYGFYNMWVSTELADTVYYTPGLGTPEVQNAYAETSTLGFQKQTGACADIKNTNPSSRGQFVVTATTTSPAIQLTGSPQTVTVNAGATQKVCFNLISGNTAANNVPFTIQACSGGFASNQCSSKTGAVSIASNGGGSSGTDPGLVPDCTKFGKDYYYDNSLNPPQCVQKQAQLDPIWLGLGVLGIIGILGVVALLVRKK